MKQLHSSIKNIKKNYREKLPEYASQIIRANKDADVFSLGTPTKSSKSAANTQTLVPPEVPRTMRRMHTQLAEPVSKGNEEIKRDTEFLSDQLSEGITSTQGPDEGGA